MVGWRRFTWRRFTWRRFTWRRFTWLMCGCACLAFGCGERRDGETEQGNAATISLALNWFPEAEHGGFIAADVSGLFQQEGLDVTILPGGPGAPVVQQVATGRVTFAVANADQVLLGRQQGAPVVAVMAAMQQSPRCIMVHRESGVETLRELNDLTLSIGAGKPFAKYLLKELGAADLKIVPYQGNVTAFLQQENLAQQAYIFSEPYIARRQGADPVCLMVSDIGFNPYTSLLITSERMIAEQPDVVRKVVHASVRGWRKYLDDPEETNGRIASMNSAMTHDVLAFGADAIRPLCIEPNNPAWPLGAMTAERWQQLAEQLQSVELLDDTRVYQDAFDLQFLP